MNEQNARKKRILIVDDESQIGKIFSLKLKLAGYDASSTTSGAEAIEMVRTQDFDLILLDVLMPETTGLDVLYEVRTFSQVPIILFTARADIFEKARQYGANDYISKPLNPDHLLGKIDKILSAGKG